MEDRTTFLNSSNFTELLTVNYTGLLNATEFDLVGLAMVIFIGVACTITFLYNLLILATFCYEPRIRTPFNLYLLNLTISDILIAFLVMPFAMENTLHLVWRYEAWLCSFLLHCGWVCTGASAHAVMWISWDRLWSLLYPVHYRRRRSKKLTGLICGTMWIYLTIITIPYSILDQKYYRYESICRSNVAAQPIYTLVLEVILYILPLTVVSSIYSVIIIVLFKRRQAITPQIPQRQVPSTGNSASSTRRVTSQKHASSQNVSSVADSQHHERNETRLFIVLAWLSTWMIVLWSPAAIFFITASYIPSIYTSTAMAIVLCMEYSSCAINPFVYHRGLPDINQALNSLILFCLPHESS